MSTEADRMHERLHRAAADVGRTVVYQGEVLRHGVYTRVVHWTVAIFVIAFTLQMVNWLRPMRWKESDRRWLKRIKAYTTNEEKLEAEDVGQFNGGQKIWFWAIDISGVVFLITGLLMWWPEIFGRVLMWISYFFHDVAA